MPKKVKLSTESTGDKRKRLVLIDAHAILHRAYHALPQFSNSRGEPTGGLYGLAAMLIKIIATFKPDYIAAAYDLPKPTFRHVAYEAYKAGRAKADDALISQMKRSRELFEAFNIPIYDKEGFEADDILGTIVSQVVTDKARPTERFQSFGRGLSLPAEASAQVGIKDFPVDIVIASGDMDTLQLVDGERVQVFTLKKGINDTMLYDEKAVKTRYGFRPELLPDFKGLSGDPSDNIKGVAGIGEKTASELISKFGSIENIYKQLGAQPARPSGRSGGRSTLNASFKPRVLSLLEQGKEDAEFSKVLATIRRDAPITFSLPDKPWRETTNVARAEKLFGELEFRQLKQRLSDTIAMLNGKEEEKKLASSPDSHPLVRRGGHSPLEKGESGKAPAQTSLTDALTASGIPPRELKETSVALWLVNSNLANPKLEDIYGFTGTRLPAAESAAQAGEWKEARQAVFDELKKRTLTRVVEEIEQPLVEIVERMNERGVALDVPFLRKLSLEYHQELSSRERQIWKLAGKEFNINSPRQVGEVLFTTLGLKAARQKRTALGALSTRESELLKLRDLHPVVGIILEYREFQKLLSTYIDNLPGMVGKDPNGSARGGSERASKRLHANFLSAGSTTGRMTSEHPNLQNIPMHTPLGKRIREAFIAEKGNVLLSLDYSQIELRIAAFMSRDPKFMEIFKEGVDVHAAVAAEILRIPRERVTKDERRKAKVINFGILYGMGVNSLRAALSDGGLPVSRQEAQEFLNEYFARFPVLARYLEETKAVARERGYTETLFGRRRNFESLRSSIQYIRAAAERQAANAPLQGTGADLIKLAMVRIDALLQKEKLQDSVSLILQVHDELVYEVKESLVKTVAPKLKDIMEHVVSARETHGVPIVADASAGKNWGEMQKLEGST